MVLPKFKLPAPKTDGGWFRAYDHKWCGASGIVAALQEVIASEGAKTVTLVLADHHTTGNSAYRVATIGLMTVTGMPMLRYCASGGDPEGGGSSSLGPANELAECAAELALHIAGSPSRGTIFRQPSEIRISWDIDGTLT